ncbi:uncharacterized protein MYCFIDRAFT_175075 [Pseudocercospora fijiensis CIRAD86]|uniref:Gfd2/YDR514C-like C-terminal domain-containing protein n=1 Tax=Pseudocercospora fijiensis (strain CIRAD86) TaxID=383855 RepID=M3B2M7_PSEFD|nr:uncharacterized protein MYCFIDRAFT_175075 [Pseudocercospora fijiensis CIRAD86]EME83647.1 hypothetical protein MYCFIDRAFT_175075 [Pseudocercospora fijiensis CIRAD86]
MFVIRVEGTSLDSFVSEAISISIHFMHLQSIINCSLCYPLSIRSNDIESRDCTGELSVLPMLLVYIPTGILCQLPNSDPVSPDTSLTSTLGPSLFHQNDNGLSIPVLTDARGQKILKPSSLKSRRKAPKPPIALPVVSAPNEASVQPIKPLLSGRNRVAARRSTLLPLRTVSQQRLALLTAQSSVVPLPTPNLKNRTSFLARLSQSRVSPAVLRSLGLRRWIPGSGLLRSSRRRPEDCGDIYSLQSMLGLRAAESSLSNVTLLSLDLEWRPSPGSFQITEIGISVLKTKNIRGAAFGPYGHGWFAKMEHRTQSPTAAICFGTDHLDPKPIAPSLFASTQRLSHVQAREEIARVIASLDSDNDPGQLVIVGQSVEGDIQRLRRDPLYAIDMRKCSGADMPFHSILDTFDLARAARRRGTRFRTLRLSGIARTAGIDPKYWMKQRDLFGNVSALVGVHNASNDAAYALMTALLLGMRWNDLVGSEEKRMARARVWNTSRGTRLPAQVAVKTFTDEEWKACAPAARARKKRWRTHRDRRQARTEEAEMEETTTEIERPDWLQWITSLFSRT